MGRKYDFQEPGVVLDSFYIKLLLFILVSNFIRKFDQKLNFQRKFARSRLHKQRIGHKQRENLVAKSNEWYYLVSLYNYY